MAGRSLSQARAPVIRMCVGCRVRAAKTDLLRVVGRGNEVVPDPQARLPGRGAYVHPSQMCFEQAQRRRAFARALRLAGPVTAGILGQYLAEWCEESPQARPGGQARAAGQRQVLPGKQGSIVMSAR